MEYIVRYYFLKIDNAFVVVYGIPFLEDWTGNNIF